MTQPDWDDERIAAAFRARFDRPAPPTLAVDVHRAIAGTAPARPTPFGRGHAWVKLAAAVVVVVVTGTALLGLGGLGRLGGAPSSSAPAATPSGDVGAPASSAPEAPGSILGLDVLSVSAALGVRDTGVDDREVAVHGWFTPAPAISCGPAPASRAVSPVQVRCPDQNVWLTEAAESLVQVTADTMSMGAPRSPALNPDLDGLDLSWEPLPLTIGADVASIPAQVVFVGHFDDRRASLCPTEEAGACRDRFVVDQVAWVDGATPTRSMVGLTDFPWTSSVAAIEAVIAEEAPQSPILSIQIVHGAALGDTQPSIEPSLANGQGGLTDRPGLWIVRVLESERLSTYIVDDGNGRIYEMNRDGEAVDVGGQPAASAPAASATPAGPWPPPGATVIALTSDVVPGAPPVQVAVVDLSGRLLHVAEKGTVDPSDPTVSVGDPGAYTEPSKPGRLHLAWTGSICDGRITVTVAADVRSMILENGRRPTCDAIGIGRELVLDFSGSVVVPAVLETTANHTTPAGRDYELICGSLDQATCEDRAIRFVGSGFDSPGKRVVSVTFSADPCGSFSVLYDDGTSTSTIVDCFIPPSPN